MDISEITNSSEVGSFSINQNFLKPKIYPDLKFIKELIPPTQTLGILSSPDCCKNQ